jgi:aspartyl-tRNA(Asn)/glutamyl-tRNA(Gln) amidotransferase subunit A
VLASIAVAEILRLSAINLTTLTNGAEGILVTEIPAFKIGERIDDPLAMYLFDLYTVSTNLAGIAGMSIPCGFSASGLPIGLHLQAPPLAEDRLLRGAAMFQRATDWHTRKPALDAK